MTELKIAASPRDIMMNLKFIMDHDLLLQEDFYREDNLKAVFGGEKVNLDMRDESNSNQVVRASISGFEKIAPKVPTINKYFTEAFGLRLARNYQEGELASGSIQWTNQRRESNLVFEELIEILGRPNRIYLKPPKHVNQLASKDFEFKDKTHRHGDETLEYLSKNSKVIRAMSLLLFFDGTLYYGSFGVQRAAQSQN